MKWNDYVMVKVFVLHENMFVKRQRKKNGGKNDKMENITPGWFFLRWFQHDILMVLRNEEISCFTHKPIRV